MTAPKSEYIERRHIHIRLPRGDKLDAVHALVMAHLRRGVDVKSMGAGPQQSAAGEIIRGGAYAIEAYAAHETEAYDELIDLLKSFGCRKVRR